MYLPDYVLAGMSYVRNLLDTVSNAQIKKQPVRHNPILASAHRSTNSSHVSVVYKASNTIASNRFIAQCQPGVSKCFTLV